MANNALQHKSEQQADVSTSDLLNEVLTMKAAALVLVQQCERIEKQIAPGERKSRKQPLSKEQLAQAGLQLRKRLLKKSA